MKRDPTLATIWGVTIVICALIISLTVFGGLMWRDTVGGYCARIECRGNAPGRCPLPDICR